MNKKQISIIKPQYHSDIYTQINRSCDIEEELNLNRVLEYEPEEEKKVFVFIDFNKNWVFSYPTKAESLEQGEKVNLYMFKTSEETLKYLKGLKEQFKNNEEVYLSELNNRIKELKLLIESQKPNKIKEITKGKTTLKIGDLLNTNWGYDQTNIEMFRVVKIIGKNYFIIQEIGQKTAEGTEGFMCCSVTAGKNDLNKLPIKGFISNDGYMSICESGYKRGLSVTDKDSKHYNSWYA